MKKLNVYISNGENTHGGKITVSIFKLIWWIIKGNVTIKDQEHQFYIDRIETTDGKRI